MTVLCRQDEAAEGADEKPGADRPIMSGFRSAQGQLAFRQDQAEDRCNDGDGCRLLHGARVRRHLAPQPHGRDGFVDEGEDQGAKPMIVRRPLIAAE